MMLDILILLLALSQTLISAAPTTYLSDASEYSILSEAIEALPEALFNEDYILTRKGADLFTNKEKKGKITFKMRTKHPAEAPVIILNGFEDNLRRADASVAQQQTFVVLRKKADSKDDYYLNYIYLRNLFKDEPATGSGIVELKGVKKHLEFDIWDRRGESGNYEQHFGWTICTRSFFVSCVGPTTTSDGNKLVPFQDSGDVASVDYEDVSQDEVAATPEVQAEDAASKTPAKSFVNLKNDYFTDLDDEFEHAWFVGALVILAVNTKLKVHTVVGNAVLDLSTTAEASKVAKRALFGGSAATASACPYGPANRGVTDNALDSFNTGVNNDILGDGSKGDGRWREGSDHRGMHGDRDNAADTGLLKPIDSLTGSLNGFMGYSPDKPSNTSGQRWANGVRNGGGAYAGLSEGAADALGMAMGVGTISDDRSHLDGILEEALAGILGGLGGTIIDTVGIVAKPLGLDPLLGMVAGLGGMILGTTMGGPAAVVIAPLKSGIDFGKVAFKALGLGGLIGMKGSSNKACFNKLAYIQQYADSQRQYNNQYNQENGIEDGNDNDNDDNSGGGGNGDGDNNDGNDGDGNDQDQGGDGDYDGGNGGGGGNGNGNGNQDQDYGNDENGNGNSGGNGNKNRGGNGNRKGGGNGNRGNGKFRGSVQVHVDVTISNGEAHPSGRTFGSSAFTYKKSYAEKQSSLDAAIDLYNPLGWRGLLSQDSEPFVGIGNCLENVSLTVEDLDILKDKHTPSEFANFYLTSLKTRCSDVTFDNLVKLIESKTLILNDDGTIGLTPEYNMASKQKLFPAELSELSQAYEITIYSKAYANCLRAHAGVDVVRESPDGGLISRSIYFLIKFALEVFAEAVKNVGAHLIKIVRNTLLSLKTTFVKLMQDSHILTLCQICMPEEKEAIHQNLLSIYTLMQFLMNRFEPEVQDNPGNASNPDELEQSYNEFYKAKLTVFTERLEWYTSVPLGKNIYSPVEAEEPKV